MVADEMRRAKEKAYDKWQDLAQLIYFIVDYALSMQGDLPIIFICHSQGDILTVFGILEGVDIVV